MIRRACILLTLVVAQASRAEEPPAAPLENTRQELKSLQKGSAQGADTSALGKLRDVMPQSPTPGAEVLPFDVPKSERSESALKKKKDAQKNWLLEGMDQLDKTPKGKAGDRSRADSNVAGDDEKAKDESDEPPSLLTLYSAQQKNTEAKAEAHQAPKPARNDAMTPFLQGWLADSPVRGKFFDEYVKKPDSAAVGSDAGSPIIQTVNSGGPSLSGLDLGGASPRNTSSGPTHAQANPYLQGLDLAGLQDSGPGGSRSVVSNPVLQTGPLVPTQPLLDPLPAVKPLDRKQPLPALTDDKKYFPQLNKF